MSAFNCLVIDVGGTTLRAGVASDGRLVHSSVIRCPSPSFLTHPQASTEELQRLLLELIRSVTERLQTQYPRLQLDRMTMAVPGPVRKEGVICAAPPLWGRTERSFNLANRLRRSLGLSCVIVNDMTAVTTWYGHLPALQRHRRICVITVSSGIGNKVIDTKTGELLMDARGFSGEIGHATIPSVPSRLRCDCGARGHLSAIASGRGACRFAKYLADIKSSLFRQSLVRQWAGQPGKITTTHLASGAKRGDRFALAVLDQVTLPISHALCILLGGVGIEKVIFVGGFALGVGQPYLKALQANLVRLGLFGRSPSDIRRLVCLGSRDDAIGLRGLGLIAQRHRAWR
jgi:glucokinase